MIANRLLIPFGFAALVSLSGCTVPGQPADTAEPAAEAMPPVKVDLPPLIKLEGSMPPEAHADHKLRVDGLLARKDKHLGKPVAVRGYIVEKYECPKDAKRCERPHVWLADTPAGGDKRLMVVSLREEMAAQMIVGEQRVIVGTFARKSDDGFLMSGGLIIFESMEGMEPVQEQPKKRR